MRMGEVRPRLDAFKKLIIHLLLDTSRFETAFERVT
jgi:hypothetical protein